MYKNLIIQLAIAAGILATAALSQAADKPKVIIVITDEQGQHHAGRVVTPAHSGECVQQPIFGCSFIIHHTH